ncbi:hypothetical protein D7X88_03140 [bacterium C-53]|nr:hypothetical protein [Lachnospiraceae bacterium]NBI02013.1 hypothetical protein [Lachnospiraceae bacterium]RKJ12403.1 hypothetical protein D7X88_03140 [bacterium C-53]
MHTKTMEGLVGARTNMNLMNTPMRVYREARRKGDMAAMERAMGYAGDFSDKSKEYKAEADEGMKEDAEEAREKAKLQREETLRKRKEEREKLEERIAENGNADTSTDIREAGGCVLEISRKGKMLVNNHLDADTTDEETGEIQVACEGD